MALSRNEIQKKSDEKRGVKVKAFKMKLEDIALIEETAAKLGISQVDLVIRAVQQFAENG
nr:ribbon-helix-helix protein, CopG family [uncultured Kingella sp.]